MSDYIITSNGELIHYGVPGMRWGHRKVTIGQAAKNVRKARKDVVEKMNDSPKKYTLHQYKSAVRKVSKESVSRDKDHNKQLRAGTKKEIDRDINFNIRDKAINLLKSGKIDKYDTVVGKTGRRFILDDNGRLRQVNLSPSDSKKLAKKYNKKVSKLLKKSGSNVLREPVTVNI